MKYSEASDLPTGQKTSSRSSLKKEPAPPSNSSGQVTLNFTIHLEI